MDFGPLLSWIKETTPKGKHFADVRIEPIPNQFREQILNILHDYFKPEDYESELEHNYFQVRLICRAILLNSERMDLVPESFWGEQYLWIRERISYFKELRHKPFDPNQSTDFQIQDKIFAIEQLEYLSVLQERLINKIKYSKLLENELAYLFG